MCKPYYKHCLYYLKNENIWVQVIVEHTNFKQWPLGSVITSLPTDQEVSSSIPDSAIGELFQGLYILGVSVFGSPLSIFSPVQFSKEILALCGPEEAL